MVNELNRLMVAELTRHFSEMSHCVVIDYRGLTSEESVELRARLRGKDVRMTVVKNRIARHAFEAAGLGAVSELLQGQCAIVSGGEDMPSAAKAITEWMREAKKMAVLGGYAEGRVLDEPGVRKMAKIPARPVLLSMMLGAIQAVPQRVAGAFQSLHSSLARAFEEIRKQKETAEGGDAAAESA